ncbi:helix-turn-helix domain-containing protein [uncultured Robinsoniella sp.]|uniref:helix-turn-helix domain-containing protein n=1 Tax=uncultured Robinsoniella sp. TaxID=904190 RepID=UPI00374E23B5
MSTIGERLKEWRKSNKLTMKEVCEKAEISQGGLSDCENDKILLGTKVLLSLYRTYKIDIAWILTGIKGVETNNLSENEKELLENFSFLPEREQIKFIARLEDAAEKYKEIEKTESLSSRTG